MSNYNSLKNTIDANIKQNGNQEITGQVLNSVLNQMVTTLGAGYQFVGVATTATNPGSPDAKVFYIANGKGTYTNFGGLEVTEDDVVVLYYDTEWHKVATGIASHEKLTELESQVIYDVTTNNGGATFASLSALLSSENLSTLIPTSVRCGGMSIRFVQSSDNKYVQYRLMLNSWSSAITDWQGIIDEVLEYNESGVKSTGIYKEIETQNDIAFENIVGYNSKNILDLYQATIISRNNRTSIAQKDVIFTSGSSSAGESANIIIPIKQNKKYKFVYTVDGIGLFEFGVKFTETSPTVWSDVGFDLSHSEFNSGNNNYCVLFTWIDVNAYAQVNIQIHEYPIDKISESVDDLLIKTKALEIYERITSGITPNTYINTQGGVSPYTEELNRFASTDFIELPKYVKFKIKNFTEGGACLAVYNGDKALSRVFTNNVVSDEYIQIELKEPEKYIRTTIISDIQPDITYCEIFYNENPIEKLIRYYLQPTYSNIFSMFDNLVALGDSLTYGYVRINPSTTRQAKTPYPDAIRKLSGMQSSQIIAKSGASASYLWNHYSSELVSKNNAVCLIYLGCNEGLTDTFVSDVSSHESYSDYADTNTGCYGKWIAKALELGYRVVLIRPYAVGGGGDLAVTNNVIAQAANYFNVLYIDAPYNLSPEYFYFADISAGINGDDVHYNDVGYVWFANQVIKRVSQLGDSLKYFLTPS